jgi:hypothetical protein
VTTTATEHARAEKSLRLVHHLVSLAVDPAAALEEGRTAAFTAIKLIKSSGLEIVSPVLRSNASSSSAGNSSKSNSNASSSSTPGSRDGSSSSREQRRTDDTRSGEASRQPHSARDSQAKNKPRTIRVRYSSRCRVCGDVINVGVEAAWMPGNGVAHLRCGGAA